MATYSFSDFLKPIDFSNLRIPKDIFNNSTSGYIGFSSSTTSQTINVDITTPKWIIVYYFGSPGYDISLTGVGSASYTFDTGSSYSSTYYYHYRVYPITSSSVVLNSSAAASIYCYYTIIDFPLTLSASNWSSSTTSGNTTVSGLDPTKYYISNRNLGSYIDSTSGIYLTKPSSSSVSISIFYVIFSTNLTEDDVAEKVNLQVNDIINLSAGTNNYNIDLKGASVRFDLYGRNYSDGGYTTGVLDSSLLTNTDITVGCYSDSFYVAAGTWNTYADLLYYRFLVAGAPGGIGNTSGTSYNGGAGGGESGTYGYNQQNIPASGAPGTQSISGSGGNYNGNDWYSPRGNGSSGSFGYGGIGNYGGNGGAGWYGGGSGAYGSNTSSQRRWGTGGGGSGYVLTNNSYIPYGYMSNWEEYADAITNGSTTAGTVVYSGGSSRQSKITILALPPEPPSTQSVLEYYNGTEFIDTNANYYDGTEWVPCDAYYYDGIEWVEIGKKAEEEIIEGCIKFSSKDGEFSLKTNNTSKNWDGTLEYSADNSTWNTWNGTEINSTNKKLYLRGTGNTKITGNSSNSRFVLTGSNIKCEGNIENLLNYQTVANNQHPSMGNYCYDYMFQGCSSLVEAPTLPAITLTTLCYEHMFDGCTALTKAPELPATIAGNSCYQYMFNNCTALTDAPELPATELANNCYYKMFYGCTSLTKIPELPATSLKSYCYNQMFYGCSKIKLSTTQSETYQNPYRIPTSGTGTTTSNSLTNMFTNTGGTFADTPEINTTYYTSNEVV